MSHIGDTSNINNNNNITKNNLLSLQSVRTAAKEVMEQSMMNPSTSAFNINLSLLPSATNLVISLINRDYRQSDTEPISDVLQRIPPHGRWRHFRSLDQLKNGPSGKNDYSKEHECNKFIDLFVVAVLMDAGAGDRWTFIEQDGQRSSRSEGLAMATLSMFMRGKFCTSSPLLTDCLQVTSEGLLSLVKEDIIEGFQVSIANPLVGIDGRLSLLKGLGSALKAKALSRPSDILKGLIKEGGTLDVLQFWSLLIDLFNPIWPISATNDGLGDVFELRGKMVPFHKLTQWMCYSLLEPISLILNVEIINQSMLTGLPEYRNGGMLVDLGILKLKDSVDAEEEDEEQALYSPKHPTIIEWRALTIVLLDMIAEDIRRVLCASVEELPLAKVLEAGTWKAGRELAKEKRSSSGGGPPIRIISDGTIF